jgi:hypothetical protein
MRFLSFLHISQLNKLFALTALFCLVGFFGTGAFVLLASMTMSTDGLMADCPFMQHGATLCPMGVSGHLALWQSFSAVILNQETLVFLALTFLVVLIILGVKKVMAGYSPPWQHWRNEKNREPESKLFNFLLPALARGVIQPRIFA